MLAIRIENPTASTDAGFVTLKRARQLIERRLAEFIAPGVIRITVKHGGFQTVEQREYEKAMKNSPDLRQRHLKHIPFVGDISKLGVSA
jgi:hypothetical protein